MTSGTADPNRPTMTRASLTTAEADATIEIEVALKMRDLAGLQARVHRGEMVTPDELAARYQPAAADYQAVTDWLVGAGLTITRSDPSRVAVFARGTVRQLAAAFQVTFARVAFQGEEFTSALTAPSLPGALADAALGVNGLQQHMRPRKHLRPGPAPLSTASTTAVPYWPRDILRAYGGGGLAQTGAGQTIGIIIDTFPANSDLTSFWTTAGVPQSLANMEFVQVVGGVLPSPTGEETLDVEWSSGIASAAKIRVYATLDLSYAHLDQAYAQAYSEVSSGVQPTLHQLSMSYGEGETNVSASQLNTDEQYFAELAAVGVSLFASAGDGGSNPNSNTGGTNGPLQVESPASSTSVTGVGGTSLALNSSTGAVTSETVWKNGSGATGGGTSIVFARPAWQVGPGVAAGSFRLVPDVAAAADPNQGGLVFLNGTAQQYGGTSWSSPAWAGFCALINQARSGTNQGPLGLLGPNLYPLLGTPAFRDITSGGNGAYSAGAGFDETTGLGVPNLTALVSALSDSPSITAGTQTQTAAPGATAVFTVVGGGAPPLVFQWQRLPVGASTWGSLTDNATYSGSTTATLSVAGVTSAMTGDQFRCTLGNPFGSVTSAPAGLIVALPCLVQTIAGVAGAKGSTNGAALSATFNFLNGIAEDTNGNIYLGDMSNDTIRKLTAAGIVSTFAGATGVTGRNNSTIGTSSQFNGPAGVATDAAGNIYVADFYNNEIRKITPAGAVSLLAGSSSGRSGSGNNTGTSARFKGPADLAVDPAGNLYVADQTNNLIRKITPAGVVTTLAGSGAAGSADGTGTKASFNQPGGLGLDPAGNLFVADSYNHTIRKITPAGAVTTVAGSPGTTGSADGLTGAAARFNYPGDVQPDAFGNVYVVDSNNHTLREILASGPVITVAGVAGTAGTTDGVGPAALFNGPGSIVLEPGGTLALADTNNNTLRRVTQIAVPQVRITPGVLTLTAANNAEFSTTLAGFPAPACQWQWRPAGGSAWINLTDDGTYSGSATGTLTVVGVTLAMSGDQFQCVATNVAGTATSAPATLTVQVAPQITSTAGANFLVGQPGSFTVTATGTPTATFSAGGLPAWASLDPASGLLAGTPPNGAGSPFAVTIFASNGAVPNAIQNFTLVVQDTFAAWQAANFTAAQLANPAVSSPTAVLGPDNTPNLLKYALGLPPTAAVLAGSQTVAASGTTYSFIYKRPAAVTDVTYVVQQSSDLQSWTSAGVTQQLLSTDAAGIQTWQAQSTTTATAVFFRLLVTQP